MSTTITLRMGKGNTLLVGLTQPEHTSVYGVYVPAWDACMQPLDTPEIDELDGVELTIEDDGRVTTRTLGAGYIGALVP